MSSKRAVRRKQCGDKQRYADQSAAIGACIAMRRKGIALTTYRCKFCRHWHVGHTPAADIRRAEARQDWMVR